MKKKKNDKDYISCPRCARKNKLEDIKCVNCGQSLKYNKNKFLIIYLVLFSLIIGLLIIGKVFKIYNIIINIVIIFLLVYFVLKLFISLFYQNKMNVYYISEENIKPLSKKEKIFKALFLIGLLLSLGCISFILIKYMPKVFMTLKNKYPYIYKSIIRFWNFIKYIVLWEW